MAEGSTPRSECGCFVIAKFNVGIYLMVSILAGMLGMMLSVADAGGF